MRILLAVSGGVDSMYLAHNASALFAGASFAVAHCNFSLRGSESDGDEEFVREYCAGAGIECFVRRFDTAGYAAALGISVEMAARELRYSWFRDLCRESSDGGFDAVAVAHNADDNAETLLLNIVRGCGSRGLRGMSADSVVDGLRILRPMLGISRAEIEERMKLSGFGWREDSTNALCEVKRNVLRHKVLPVLRELNPSILDTLASDMEHWAQVDDIAEEAYADFLRENAPSLLEGGTESDISIELGAFARTAHPDYMLWRLTQGRLGPGQLSDLADAVRRQTGPDRDNDFAGKSYGSVVTGSDCIVLCARKDRTEGSITVTGPGTYDLDGTRVSILLAHREPGSPLKAPAGILFARAAFPFVLRHWQDGDFIRPFGLGGRRRKLSDIFSDLRLSIPAKRSTPVLASEGSHVLAIVGHRIDESLALDDSDKEYLIIRKF